MHRWTFAALCALAALFVLAPAAIAAPSDKGLSHRSVCPPAPTGYAQCHSKVTVDPHGKPVRTQPVDWSGLDLEDAYNLPGPASDDGTGPAVIAIVDAFGYSGAEDDLNTYRAANGMQPCTTDNGCFKKLDQRGGTSYPAEDTGWSQETALDLDMASAACPKCKIVLVQADTNSFVNLAAAEDTAAAQAGVVAISNSYGGPEFSAETSPAYASHYDHPNIAITVSSGDNGYGTEFPAAAKTVVAVGGTSLRKPTSTTWSETAWSGAGSGCSAYVSKPAWQSDTGCARRMVADVSAVADPNTGVRVYGPTGTGPGWMVFGGTSASAPLIAGVYGVQHDSAAVAYPASTPYSRTSLLTDVTSGSNGRCRNVPSYFCNAQSGYDGPTGLGTPNGSGAF
jgi:subtilase family serine protease